MPKLHVIYDPTDKLQTQHQDLPKAIKLAVLDVEDDLTYPQLEMVIRQLTSLLMQQVCGVE